MDIVTDIDIIGKLPKTTTGYRYILTIIDYATWYPEAIPLRSTNSTTIADALIQYFSRVGIPDEIVSDQGSSFISKLMNGPAVRSIRDHYDQNVSTPP